MEAETLQGSVEEGGLVRCAVCSKGVGVRFGGAAKLCSKGVFVLTFGLCSPSDRRRRARLSKLLRSKKVHRSRKRRLDGLSTAMGDGRIEKGDLRGGPVRGKRELWVFCISEELNHLWRGGDHGIPGESNLDLPGVFSRGYVWMSLSLERVSFRGTCTILSTLPFKGDKCKIENGLSSTAKHLNCPVWFGTFSKMTG